jgi:hypothetical protein
MQTYKVKDIQNILKKQNWLIIEKKSKIRDSDYLSISKLRQIVIFRKFGT